MSTRSHILQMKVDYEVLHDFDKQEEGDLTVKTGEVVTLISIRLVSPLIYTIIAVLQC